MEFLTIVIQVFREFENRKSQTKSAKQYLRTYYKVPSVAFGDHFGFVSSIPNICI